MPSHEDVLQLIDDQLAKMAEMLDEARQELKRIRPELAKKEGQKE